MEQSGITLSQPKVFCRKPVQVNSELFKNVFNVVKDLALQKYTSLPKDLLDLFAGVKFEDNPAEKGWVLINRALRNAMVALALESQDLKTEDDLDFETLDEQFTEVFGDDSIVIETDFFKYPKKLSVIEKIKSIFTKFLTRCGLEEIPASNIANRLPRYFLFALVEEWRKNGHDYKIIADTLNTPLNEAESKELGWWRYSAWLEKQIDEPMFSESFSLRQIYVPLRAYYKEKIQERGRLVDADFEEPQNKVKRVVVDLEKELDNWVNRFDNNDSLRIISGGPGYGKSSFLKMFAAHQIEQGRVKVLFIPLHCFKIRDDLRDAMRDFLQYDNHLKHNPLDDKERLLIIFDGLDELVMQGKALADIANQFMVEVKDKLKLFNYQTTRLLILLSGRDIIIQSNEHEFRQLHQTLYILPYYIESPKEYEDKDNLLSVDQRNIWWNNYGRIKDMSYARLPKNLRKKELNEITKQPLLNYLVALGYERNVLNLAQETTLNEIYDDLFRAVYERKYDKETHNTIRHIKEYGDYLKVLQEIAISAWYDGGRTTTVERIEKQCSDSGISEKLKELFSDMDKGVITLLISFYFRKSGVTLKGDTFEFTHKSFGEFLTAKGIVAKVKQIDKNLIKNKENSESGWNIKKCLKEWIKMFGFKEIDADLFRFILTEMKREYKENRGNVERLQNTLVELFNFMLLNGMPAEKLEENSYFQANKLAVTAEKALLILLDSVVLNTKKISQVIWPNQYSCGEFISRIMGQRKEEYEFILKHFNYCRMENCCLIFRDLRGAVLKGADLRRANLRGADLNGADLNGVDLRGADLREVDLRGSDLDGAYLRLVDLREADLRGVDLRKAYISGAYFSRADLRGADLRGADLSGADLRGADLRWANLTGADLSWVYLDGADLTEVNLSDVDLSKVDLRSVNLSKVDLSVARNVPEEYLKRSKKKTT